MAFLTPDRTYTVKVGSETLTIKEKIIPDGTRATKDICSYIKKGELVKPNAKLNNGTGKPKGICVHNTEIITVASGTNPAEQYTRATYNGNMAGVVVTFYIWMFEIWQLLSDTERGFHAADGSTRRSSQRTGETIGGNLDTISIECIGKDAASEQTTAKLVAYLLSKHGLNPKTDVYTHKYFYPVKYCPAYILPHWGAFMDNVMKYFNSIQAASISPAPPSPSNPSPLDNFKVGEIVYYKGGAHYSNSTAAVPSDDKVKESRSIITSTNAAGKYPVHIRAINDKGEFVSGGVYGWVKLDSINKIEIAPPAPAPLKYTIGEKVSIKSSANNYYPGSAAIPSWVKTDYYHIITQTTSSGKPVIKGGRECVLLGQKINKKTGKTESGINTWVDKQILTL